MTPVNRRAAAVHAAAGAWSALYLGLGLAWLFGAGGNPADPAVDTAIADTPGLSLLGMWGPQAGAAILAGLGAAGLVLTVLLVHPVGYARGGRLVAGAAVVLGLVLCVVLPDYRLLAMVAYTPIIAVLALFGAVPEEAPIWPWPIVNLALLTLAGLAFLTTAAGYRRRAAPPGLADAPGLADPRRVSPAVATRWGRVAVGVAVTVPVGYAVTRFAWALGIPLGVTRELLDELGNGVYAGAALATLAVGGAVLTLGLVQRWGEVFPRWMPVVRGRPVPVRLATVPARVVAVIVTSAGLMFVRMAAAGGFGGMPFDGSDIAAWLPELFWPLWGVALAAASYAYEARRAATGTPRPARPAPPAPAAARTGDRSAAPGPVPAPRIRGAHRGTG
jgi:hypothetical protein